LEVGGIYLGIDVGATKIRAALSDGKEILSQLKEATEKKSAEAFIKQLISLAQTLCKKGGIKPSELDAITVASFGPMDYKAGELINPVHLPFKKVPIIAPLQKKLGTNVYLINDCIAAALGEHEFGRGKGVDNFVFINLGAGIGAGIYVDGRLLFGKDGNAHEIGHYTIDLKGELKCSCGKRGHWEAYCSGPGIQNFTKLRGYPLTPEELLEKAEKGEKRALELLEEIGRLNAIGFANVINSYDPEVIAVGGAIGLAGGNLLLPLIEKYVRDYAVNVLPRIELCKLGEEAGMYGAVVAAGQSYFLEFMKRL
jgi:glucokinase